MIRIYTWAMRRMLAIMMLLAFGSPLVAPLLAATADPEARLPACCRSHGTHHCAMRHSSMAVPGAPAFQAPPCQNYPSAFTPVRIATASPFAAQPASIEIQRDCAPLAQVRRRAESNLASSGNLKRGPPAILA